MSKCTWATCYISCLHNVLSKSHGLPNSAQSQLIVVLWLLPEDRNSFSQQIRTFIFQFRGGGAQRTYRAMWRAHSRASSCTSRYTTNQRWFLSPTQFSIQGQWWSKRCTQCLHAWQCFALIGCCSGVGTQTKWQMGPIWITTTKISNNLVFCFIL